MLEQSQATISNLEK